MEFGPKTTADMQLGNSDASLGERNTYPRAPKSTVELTKAALANTLETPSDATTKENDPWDEVDRVGRCTPRDQGGGVYW